MYAYGYDENGYFTGLVDMQKNPRGGGHLLPAHATEEKVPSDIPVHQIAKWNGETWDLVAHPGYVAEKLNYRDDLGICPYEVGEDGYIKDKANYESERVEKETILELEISLNNGARIAVLSDNILNLMIDHNYSNKFNGEQITQIQTQFATIEKLLKDKRPFHAKALIDAVQVDGVVITQKLKDKIGMLYARYTP